MAELFDVALSAHDHAFTKDELKAAGRRTATCWVPTVTDEIDAEIIGAAGRPAQADRQFRGRGRSYRPRRGAREGHHGRQHPRRLYRGHRRHDHGADPVGPAPAGRGRKADALGQMAGLGAERDAGPPRRRQIARHRRHGSHRPRRRAARPAPSACRSTITTAAACPKRSKRNWARAIMRASTRCCGSATVVTIHCPHTAETHEMVSAARIGAMKPTAYLINTARGEIVDEKALIAALKTGRIAGAGLDVLYARTCGRSGPARARQCRACYPTSARRRSRAARRRAKRSSANNPCLVRRAPAARSGAGGVGLA